MRVTEGGVWTCPAERLGLMAVLMLFGSAAVAAELAPGAGRTAPTPTSISEMTQLASQSDEGDDLLDEEDEGDELLDEGDELLEDEELLEEEEEEEEEVGAPTPAGEEEGEVGRAAAEAHESLFAENRYPSANTCKVCHPKQYREWSVSQHAYAQLSPVYMAMQNTINALTSTTNGDFCIRCHNQVGMNMGESIFISNLERHPTSREGITCVVCHRLNLEYGKVSGRVGLVEGSLLKPVYGPRGNEELKRVLDNRREYVVVTEPDQEGRKIHTDVVKFPQLSRPGFCSICHDVNLFNGFRLEEAFSEYKNSPSAAEGVTCQDCHMGKVQGVASEYEFGPAAVVGDAPTKPRKLTNHFFAGPDYSLLHPGIFPHNAEAAEMATLEEWLQFDYAAGWGTDAFEDEVSDDYAFPERWEAIDDRYDARAIIDKQFELLDWAREKRFEVLRNGYVLSEVTVVEAGRDGLEFEVEVANPMGGHNVPTGFIAERLVWLEATVSDGAGQVVFRSGDLDPNGDLRDSHSLYVHNGDLPLDDQLFSLQSKFLTRNVRGGEREQVLAVNQSLDPLPFIRPSTRSTVLTGQPAGARTHRLGIPPLSSRRHSYHVDGEALTGPGPYVVTVRLKAGMIPVNLVDAIKLVGFDYGMSTRLIASRVVAGHQVLWEKTLTVEIH